MKFGLVLFGLWRGSSFLKLSLDFVFEEFFLVLLHCVDLLSLHLSFFHESAFLFFFFLDGLSLLLYDKLPVGLQISQVVFMSVQDLLKDVSLPGSLWEKLLAGVPSSWVCIFGVHSGVELGRTSSLRSSLLTVVVRSVAKHDSFIVSD